MSALDRLLSAGGIDLGPEVNGGRVAKTWFRDAEAAVVEDALDRNQSVLLVGPAGVGKTAIVHAVAAVRTAPVVQVSTTSILSGTKYLGEWETKISRIVEDARLCDATLYVSDIWNLVYAGKTSNSERN